MIQPFAKILETFISFPPSGIYSYFEKGCQKKCTRQTRKVLWVVLSSLLFKEIWKNGTRGHGRMFARAKGKRVRQLQCQEQCIDHIPYYPSYCRVHCTFFPTSFLEIAVYYELTMAWSPVDLISLRDRALRPFIAKVRVRFPVKPEFFQVFFQLLRLFIYQQGSIFNFQTLYLILA